MPLIYKQKINCIVQYAIWLVLVLVWILDWPSIEFVERLSLKFMIEQETESSQLRPAGTERKRESGGERKGHRVI